MASTGQASQQQSIIEDAARLSSQDITQRSKSNLALAFATLPAARRRDMTTFYAFCRVVDDIADDPTASLDAKRTALAHWRAAVLGETEEKPKLVVECLELATRYGFDPALLAEIIDGVASDQDRTRFQDAKELLSYCYKVASVVGLVSAYIFGTKHPKSHQYAVQLGYALQLTNILRDVGEDARETGRIYIPLDELREFEVTEDDILEGRYTRNFMRLMDFNYRRAYRYYQAAADLLVDEDRPALIAARMMAQIYSELLEKLRANSYRVFTCRESLGKARKAYILASYYVRSLFN